MKKLVVGFKGKAKDLKYLIEDKDTMDNMHKNYGLPYENHVVLTKNGEFFVDYEKIGK